MATTRLRHPASVRLDRTVRRATPQVFNDTVQQSSPEIAMLNASVRRDIAELTPLSNDLSVLPRMT
ncbi:MAG: hypothetical protein ACTHLV_18130, partial [Achromobacter mucicolens]